MHFTRSYQSTVPVENNYCTCSNQSTRPVATAASWYPQIYYNWFLLELLFILQNCDKSKQEVVGRFMSKIVPSHSENFDKPKREGLAQRCLGTIYTRGVTKQISTAFNHAKVKTKTPSVIYGVVYFSSASPQENRTRWGSPQES